LFKTTWNITVLPSDWFIWGSGGGKGEKEKKDLTFGGEVSRNSSAKCKFRWGEGKEGVRESPCGLQPGPCIVLGEKEETREEPEKAESVPKVKRWNQGKRKKKMPLLKKG